MSHRTLLALAAGALLAIPASATTILSNLPVDLTSSSQASLPFTSATSTANQAVGFAMGGTAFTFDNIVLRFNCNGLCNTAVLATATYAFGLYSDSGGNPSALLSSFTPIAALVPGSVSAETVTLTAAGVTLQANTSYWVVVSALGAGEEGKTQWSGFTGSSGTGAAFLGNRFGSSPPTAACVFPGCTGSGAAGANLAIAINGTAVSTGVPGVPEPSTWGLLALAAAGLPLVKRRQSR